MKTVIAGLIFSGDNLLIAKRNLRGSLPGKWEFPGGKLEPGETPEECLCRELYEELGIQVSVGNFFAETTYSYSFATIHLRLYWADWLGGELRLRVHQEYRWIPLSALGQYDFCPANVPLVQKLMTMKHRLEIKGWI